MAEEKKERIIRLLKNFPEERFSVSQLKDVLGNISYPTLLKWVMVLEAERKIRVDDYGNIKLISLNKEYYDGRK